MLKLETPVTDEQKSGRPRRLRQPPLPAELLDAMTPLEQEHFHFFIEAIRQRYPDLIPADLVMLNLAAMDYIILLRLQQSQLSSGDMAPFSRHHPGVQMRAWLELLSVTRKQRPQTDEKSAWKEALELLSS